MAHDSFYFLEFKQFHRRSLHSLSAVLVVYFVDLKTLFVLL